MTKQQLINELKANGSEYMYQDIGYGGFYDDSNKFVCQGRVYNPTKAELKEMLDTYYSESFGWVKDWMDQGLTKEQLMEML